MKLDKYFGAEGIVIDKNLGYVSSSKDIADLIQTMNDQGLLVNMIDMSGEVVRVPVKGTAQTRPDKANERSGWYSFFSTGTFQSCTFGNWRTGEKQSWSNTDTNKLSIAEQELLKRQIQEAQDRSNKEREKRHNEVAEDCQSRFAQAEEINEHKYLTYKKN